MFIGSTFMTDNSLHKDILLRDPLARIQDYYEAQSQIARAKSFGSIPNVEKLYLLMTVVKLPTEFTILTEIARLNGITYGELCLVLRDFPDYFHELYDSIWATTAYAEHNGYIKHTDKPHSGSPLPKEKPFNVDDFFKKQAEHPVKNGIVCMSLDEISSVAQTICQSQIYKQQHHNNYAILREFIHAIPRPIRASDLNAVVYDVLGFTIAKSTLRKYLCLHPDVFCAPTHGVWCSEKLAREMSYSDYRSRS